MIPPLLHAAIVSAALGVGALLAMTGAVTLATVDGIASIADRRLQWRDGVVMLVAGLVAFVAGTMGAGMIVA